jgi:metallophosphoesterase (TIGR00282 family)
MPIKRGAKTQYPKPDRNDKNDLTVLAFGDIVGRVGRRALAQAMPELTKEYQPDLIVANVENLAHGIGVTRKTLEEITALGIRCFTSGNHIWKKDEATQLLEDKSIPLLRPANYPPGLPGRGELVLTIGAKRLVVVNLQGRVFMKDDVDDPFRAFDALWAKYENESLAGFIVDFHAEATSEKVAFGWHVDGRATAVLGTHTHVPTADAWIMPKGTAYISDLGMVGPRHSVIGVDKDIIVRRFMTQLPLKHEIPETGEAIVNGAVVTLDPSTGRAISIDPISRILTVEE